MLPRLRNGAAAPPAGMHTRHPVRSLDSTLLSPKSPQYHAHVANREEMRQPPEHDALPAYHMEWETVDPHQRLAALFRAERVVL